MSPRTSGVLLHPSSLTGPFGVGDLGPAAAGFADFLAHARQSLWQMLPLTPTEPGRGNSPYNSASAFALNPLFLSPELMVAEKLIDEADLDGAVLPETGRADYEAAHGLKRRLCHLAFERADTGGDGFVGFCRHNAFWLDDYALFTALSRHHSGTWDHWPPELAARQPEALEAARRELAGEVELERWMQYQCQRQLNALRRHCRSRGVSLMGDLPIYVDYHSADVWAHRHLFQLGDDLRPRVVSGVPPDYFSATGQRWGNPVFDWARLAAEDFGWWVRRLERNLALYDLVRIDHFRGLVAYWEIDAWEETAINGRWRQAPVMELFRAFGRRFPGLPVVAEDLGYITPDVREALCRLGLAGMKLFIFAFGEESAANPYQPHNYPRNCVAYTGTHDNNTMRGWWTQEADDATKQRMSRYLGRELNEDNVAAEAVRAVMGSVADSVVFPLQDILGLGSEARMNTPSSKEGNWLWRLSEGMLASEPGERLLALSRLYGRA